MHGFVIPWTRPCNLLCMFGERVVASKPWSESGATSISGPDSPLCSGLFFWPRAQVSKIGLASRYMRPVDWPAMAIPRRRRSTSEWPECQPPMSRHLVRGLARHGSISRPGSAGGGNSSSASVRANEGTPFWADLWRKRHK